MTRRSPTLAHLLAEERPPDALVAWRSRPGSSDVPVHWDEFRGAVFSLTRELAVLPPGDVALYTDDSYAFAVGLFGIWHAGRAAVCPPNGQPGALAALSELVIAAVSDREDAVPGRPLLDAESATARAPESLAPLSLEQPAVLLFTSGTTGRGKAMPKRLFHLEREVQCLDANLADLVGDAPAFGSASHQHLYGMLFRVLWPLATRRPFHARMLLHAEELLPRMRAQGPCMLASVPAHLKRLAQRDGFEALVRPCRVVFSSGGPLDPETAERWEAALGDAPFEIFGSTETGGLAWRRQGRGRAGEPWTPFEGVRVSRDSSDERLRVHSPLTSLGDERTGFALGDRVRLLDDGRFVVLGRADRVLKIGEKRLSLPEMEEQLREHDFVDAVALLPLEQGGETRVAAVVALSDAGRAAQGATGNRDLSLALREHLAREWDRVLLPRSFRFVRALPENAQGKVTQPLLAQLFAPSAAGSQ